MANLLIDAYYIYICLVHLQFQLVTAYLVTSFCVLLFQEVNNACSGSYWNPTNENCESQLHKVDKVILIFFCVNLL